MREQHAIQHHQLIFTNLSNNLVGVLTHFRAGRYAVMGNIEQMFHQISVENKDRNVLCFYQAIII